MSAPTAFYECRNAAGEVIYVGVTNDPTRREWEHKCRAAFRHELDTVSFQWFADRIAAEKAEADAISGPNRPKWNRANPKASLASGCPIATLIDEWSSRRDFAKAVGAPLPVVHKWAQHGRIPSEWQWSVFSAAKSAGIGYVTAEWMLAVHARAEAA